MFACPLFRPTIVLTVHALYLRRNLSLLFVIAAAMLSAGLAVGWRDQADEAPRIEYFDVEHARLPGRQGNFVAESRKIKRMEVWTVPEKARGEQDWDAIGLMKRSSHWFSWSAWKLSMPSEPLPVLQILVRGYDESGTEVDRVSLPWIGEETLRKEVWRREH